MRTTDFNAAMGTLYKFIPQNKKATFESAIQSGNLAKVGTFLNSMPAQEQKSLATSMANTQQGAQFKSMIDKVGGQAGLNSQTSFNQAYGSAFQQANPPSNNSPASSLFIGLAAIVPAIAMLY